jgi:cytochrome c oxidase assembly factor CtaG
MHMNMHLAPLTWANAFTSWQFAPITAILVAIALALYLVGVRRYGRGGERWPIWRLGCFTAGLAVVVLATMGSPGVYGDAGLFWVHMLQHLLLVMVAPWLLSYGHPVTLLLGATEGDTRRRIAAALNSRVAKFFTFPLVPLAIYALVILGVHLSNFMDTMVTSPSLMALEHVLYLVAGYLYFSQLLTNDLPHQELSYPIRLFSLFLAMSADTVVGVIFVQAPKSPFPHLAAMQPPWGPGPLADVHGAGAMMWIGGDGLMFAMMLVVAVAWMSDRSPEAHRAGTFLESVRQSQLAGMGANGDGTLMASSNVDDDDAALDAYNAALGRLHDSD